MNIKSEADFFNDFEKIDWGGSSNPNKKDYWKIFNENWGWVIRKMNYSIGWTVDSEGNLID